jgi:ribonuclease HI
MYNLSQSFKKITYTHVRRELNKEADALANEAMDKA